MLSWNPSALTTLQGCSDLSDAMLWATNCHPNLPAKTWFSRQLQKTVERPLEPKYLALAIAQPPPPTPNKIETRHVTTAVAMAEPGVEIAQGGAQEAEPVVRDMTRGALEDFGRHSRGRGDGKNLGLSKMVDRIG